MRALTELSTNFFLASIKNEVVKALVQTVKKLEGFRSAVVYDTSPKEFKDFIAIFKEKSFRIVRKDRQEAVFGKEEVALNVFLLYFENDFKGAVGYIPEYNVMMFSWSIKNTEPFSIPLSFFDNIQKNQSDSPFYDWILSFPSCSGFYRDSTKFVEKARDTLVRITHHHTPKPVDSSNLTDILSAHNEIIHIFKEKHNVEVRIIHLKEYFKRQTDSTNNVLTSKFHISETWGVVISQERDLVGWFEYGFSSKHPLRLFSFLEEVETTEPNRL